LGARGYKQASTYRSPLFVYGDQFFPSRSPERKQGAKSFSLVTSLTITSFTKGWFFYVSLESVRYNRDESGIFKKEVINMAEYEKDTYGKRPIWQWIVIYLIIALVAYGAIYYFVLAKKGGYSSGGNNNDTQYQTPSNSAPAPSYRAPANPAPSPTTPPSTQSPSGY